MAPGPATSVLESGHMNKRCRNKRKRNFALKVSASKNQDESVTSETLGPDIWKFLPEEIIDLVVSRTPYAARCRFRTVCKRWKRVVSPPSPRMVLKDRGDGHAGFYDDAERKWYSLPSNDWAPSLGPKTAWELVDVDAGLVCYQCDVQGRVWLWVCNPLKPSSSRLIEPAYPRRDLWLYSARRPKLKLVVDRESKSFEVILLLDELPDTVVYDSRASSWRVFDVAYIPFHPLEFFVWESVVYAYDMEKNRGHQGSGLAVINPKSGIWTEFESDLPSEFKFPTHHFFLSDNNQVILVRFSYRKRPRPYLSVWKLLPESLVLKGIHDDAPNWVIDYLSKWENWQRLDLGSEADVVNLEGYRLTGACLGAGYICFTFSDGNFDGVGFRTPKCVKYSFASRDWSLVQPPKAEGWGDIISLYNWEPCLDIDPSFRDNSHTA